MRAAELMLERIDHADSPVKALLMAPELIVRGSTAPLAPANRRPPPKHRSHTSSAR
jgi:hypothetical protein